MRSGRHISTSIRGISSPRARSMRQRPPCGRPGDAILYLSVQINQLPSESDHVDRVRALWAAEMPTLDTTPMAVIARLGRTHAYVEHAMEALLAGHGLTRQSWDVLASLRRTGAPYRLTPTELYSMLMP